METKICTKRLKNLSEKIPADTWLLHGKNWLSMFLWKLFNQKQAQLAGQSLPQKEKEKKGRQKKIEKTEKDVGHFLVQIHRNKNCLNKTVVKCGAMERKGCCHVANAFPSVLELIWLTSRLKICNVQMHFWQKARGVNGL